MFWFLHLLAIFTIPYFLIFTIIGHIIYNKMQSNKEIEHREAEQMEQNRRLEEDTQTMKKWRLAKQYQEEVKDAILSINASISDTPKSLSYADSLLKEIYLNLGVEGITEHSIEKVISKVGRKDDKSSLIDVVKAEHNELKQVSNVENIELEGLSFSEQIKVLEQNNKL